jgi:hypothetical protein
LDQKIRDEAMHKHNPDAMTAAGDLLAAIQSTLPKLSGLTTSQVSSNAAIRTSSNTRAAARKTLRTLLELIYQTAQALKIDGFLMPRNQSDQGLTDTGRHFAMLRNH